MTPLHAPPRAVLRPVALAPLVFSTPPITMAQRTQSRHAKMFEHGGGHATGAGPADAEPYRVTALTAGSSPAVI